MKEELILESDLKKSHLRVNVSLMEKDLAASDSNMNRSQDKGQTE
jgi:hypothetical protein